MISLLFTALFFTGNPCEEPAQVLSPRLEKGTELLWQGTYQEEDVRQGARGKQLYEITIRLLVLDKNKDGTLLAQMTMYRLQGDPEKKSVELPPLVRIELGHLTPEGHYSLLPNDSLLQPAKRIPQPVPLVPLDRFPVSERAMFLALPQGKIQVGQTWDLAETDRPKQYWQTEETGSPRGARCYKVVMTQQNADWDSSRRISTGWQRRETIWLSATNGFAAQVERAIDRITAESLEVSHRSRMQYELKTVIPFRGESFNDRVEEIKQALGMSQQLDQLLSSPQTNRTAYDPLLKRIAYFEAAHPATENIPYREALWAIRRKAETARRGELVR